MSGGGSLPFTGTFLTLPLALVGIVLSIFGHLGRWRERKSEGRVSEVGEPESRRIEREPTPSRN